MQVKGFTLIELVVALALVATAVGTAAMAARLAVDQLERTEGGLSRQRALLSLKDRIEGERLFSVRSGEGRWSGGRFRWEAELLESGSERVPDEVSGGGPAGGFEVGLFQLSLTLRREGGGEYRYGWRAVDYRRRGEAR